MSLPQLEVTGTYLSDLAPISIRSLFLSVLRANNLPHIKTIFGKKRQYYVTVAHGTTINQTKAVQSEADADEI